MEEIKTTKLQERIASGELEALLKNWENFNDVTIHLDEELPFVFWDSDEPTRELTMKMELWEFFNLLRQMKVQAFVEFWGTIINKMHIVAISGWRPLSDKITEFIHKTRVWEFETGISREDSFLKRILEYDKKLEQNKRKSIYSLKV